MVQQCVFDCVLCHNVVLGGNSIVEVSAVCYSRYENGRPENVSSGFNILIKQRTTQPHIKSFTPDRIIQPTENVIFYRLLTQSFYTVCTKFHNRSSSTSQAGVSPLFSVTKILKHFLSPRHVIIKISIDLSILY
jgi:hypothetical protein